MPHLIRNVFADGRWWGPASGDVEPPKKVARLITNPKAWSEPPVRLDDVENGPEVVEGLRVLAADLGVDVSRRWGKARLLEEIARAQAQES